MPIEIKIFCVAGPALRAWEADCIRRLRAVRGVTLLGWSSTRDTVPTGFRESWTHGRYRRFEHEAESAEPLAPLRHGLRDSGLRETDAIPAEADVLLLLGGAAPPREGPWTAAGRCWAFRSGDGAPTHAAIPGLRETVLQKGHASLNLVDASNGAVLRGCFVPTDTDPMTTAKRIADLAARWPADAARTWNCTGAQPTAIAAKPTRAIPLPGAFDMLRYHWRRLTGSPPPNVSTPAGAWNIGVLHQPIHVLLDPDGNRNVRWLPNPSKGKARSEPFGYTDAEGELNAVYRKCREDGRGSVISRLRPKPDNILKRSRTMHDSFSDSGYPFTLMIEGKPHSLLCDPKRNEVQLLPVNAANDGYGEGVVLLGILLHAPTLFEHGGHWWLMGTRDPMPDALLHAYHAPSPTGPFTEHAFSPLKCDARNSRPAGTPFMHQGQLYRPALDASDPSRLAVWLNRVTHLDPDCFAEVPAQRIEGFPATAYGMAVRTLSAIGDLTLVDGLRSPVLSGNRANAKSGRRKHRGPIDDDDE